MAQSIGVSGREWFTMASGSFLQVALELGTVLVNPEPRVGGVRVG